MRRAGRDRMALVRLARRWRPDRNPLRRTADRLEAVVMAVLLLAFLIGTPVAAVAAGRWAANAHTRQVESAWRQVPALLLQDAPSRSAALYQPASPPRPLAEWAAPDGSARIGRVYAPPGYPEGSTVTIWIDRSGRLTGQPAQQVDLGGRMTLAVGGVIAASALVLLAAGLMVRWAVDRRRLAAWDSRWAATGPQWTRRR